MPQLAWWVGYAVGAGAVALAALARYALHGSLGSSVPLVAFVPAVFVAAAVGGLRAGLATTALALTVGLSAFVPVAEWDTPGVLVRGALFAAVGATISAALERLRALGALTAEQRQALADAEAYRAIVEEGAAYICRFAPDGTLTFVNEAYCRCFGRARAELLGTAFAPPVPDEDRPLVENWRGALAGGADLPTSEHRVILPDGRVRWLRWTNRVVRDRRHPAR
jgi:PAS domain S-box-containing protein